MAKSKRVILFHAPTAEAAKAAADAFSVAAGRLGMSWTVRSTGAGESPLLGDVSVLVVWKELSFGIKDWEGRVEEWKGGDGRGDRGEPAGGSPQLTDAVNGLIARLLGGSDAPVGHGEPPPPPPPAPKKVHTVKLGRETAGRKGKGVTVVWELPLSDDELKELATLLKNKCGTGGTAKDRRIEIQGDHRDKIADELEKLGYKVKRSGG